MIENPMISFPLLILFLPLLSFLILIFFGKRLPRQGDWVAVGSIVFTFLLAVYLFSTEWAILFAGLTVGTIAFLFEGKNGY